MKTLIFILITLLPLQLWGSQFVVQNNPKMIVSDETYEIEGEIGDIQYKEDPIAGVRTILKIQEESIHLLGGKLKANTRKVTGIPSFKIGEQVKISYRNFDGEKWFYKLVEKKPNRNFPIVSSETKTITKIKRSASNESSSKESEDGHWWRLWYLILFLPFIYGVLKNKRKEQ